MLSKLVIVNCVDSTRDGRGGRSGGGGGSIGGGRGEG